jgi:hypothetical protein
MGVPAGLIDPLVDHETPVVRVWACGCLPGARMAASEDHTAVSTGRGRDALTLTSSNHDEYLCCDHRQDPPVSHQAADAAGEQLGLSRRQVYALVKQYRGSGLVTDLVPGRSSGGRGAGRLPESVESVIEDVVRRKYLHRQKLTLAAVHREVVRTCRAQGLRAPARNTVANRIARLSPGQVANARGGGRRPGLPVGSWMPPPGIAGARMSASLARSVREGD